MGSLLGLHTVQRRQPTDHFRPNERSRLAQKVSHLWTATSNQNAVNGEVVKQNGANSPRFRPTLGGTAYLPQGSASNNLYFTANAGVVNARKPWALAALLYLDSTISGVPNTNGVVGNFSNSNGTGSFDRQIKFYWAFPNMYMQGRLYDGAGKEITGGSGFQPVPNLISVVVTAHDGFLHLFVNGKEDATPVAISNNGYNGYSNPTYFCFGNFENLAGPAHLLMIARTEGDWWSRDEAASFYSNPWQMYAPERLWFPVSSGVATTKYPPTSDIAQGGWTPSAGADLYAMLDEDPADDADYIQSSISPSGDTCEVAFVGIGAPTVDTDHTIRYRIKGDAAVPMTVALKQGSTTIKSWTHSPAPEVWTTFAQILSEAEAATITDYSQLKLSIVAN